MKSNYLILEAIKHDDEWFKHHPNASHCEEELNHIISQLMIKHPGMPEEKAYVIADTAYAMWLSSEELVKEMMVEGMSVTDISNFCFENRIAINDDLFPQEDHKVKGEPRASGSSLYSNIESNYDEINEDSSDPNEEKLLNVVCLDAFKGDSEQGSVIAKVFRTKKGDVGVIYIDNCARCDDYAQEVIKQVIGELDNLPVVLQSDFVTGESGKEYLLTHLLTAFFDYVQCGYDVPDGRAWDIANQLVHNSDGVWEEIHYRLEELLEEKKQPAIDRRGYSNKEDICPTKM